MQFMSHKNPTAKKIHRCDECLQLIQVGENYNYESFVDSYGDFGTYKAHHACREASLEANRLAESDPDSWFFIHDIPENERQHYPKAAAILSKGTHS